jgi:hypothetical protein
MAGFSGLRHSTLAGSPVTLRGEAAWRRICGRLARVVLAGASIPAEKTIGNAGNRATVLGRPRSRSSRSEL